MTCREVLDFLMDYLDGALPEGQRAEFESHLGDCPECVAYLESYRETVKIAKAASRPIGEMTVQAPEELIQAILAARRKGKK